MNDVKNNQKINKGCMLLVMSPFIFVALVLSFAVFNNLYYVFFPKKNPYPSTTSIYSKNSKKFADIMNPIRAPSPSQFQVESTGFKMVRVVRYGGTANSTPYLFVTDSNDYCYWIYGSNNELHPFFIHPKTKKEEYVNLVGKHDWPQIEYMLVTVGNNSSNGFKNATIEVQRQWLTNNAANKDPNTGKACKNAPTADIIKIRYRLEDKIYSYELPSKEMADINQRLKYRFN